MSSKLGHLISTQKKEDLLQKDEIRLLNESWRKLKSTDDTYESTGVLLFRNMFDINPQSQNLFPFRNEENIYESKVLKKIGV